MISYGLQMTRSSCHDPSVAARLGQGISGSFCPYKAPVPSAPSVSVRFDWSTVGAKGPSSTGHLTIWEPAACLAGYRHHGHRHHIRHHLSVRPASRNRFPQDGRDALTHVDQVKACDRMARRHGVTPTRARVEVSGPVFWCKRDRRGLVQNTLRLDVHNRETGVVGSDTLR